jgi:fatty-acyl-CoA synthase
MVEYPRIKNISDIEEIEKIDATQRVPAQNTYKLLEIGAAQKPEATAITFIENAEDFENPILITYRQLIGKIRQTANMFYDLGLREGDVVTDVLPNLPETHYVLWGSEAAGISNPINPFLEADVIKDICIAAGTKILVAQGEVPGSDIWEKIDSIKKDIPGLKAIIRIGGKSDEKNGIYGFDETIAQYPGDHLIFNRDIKGSDTASLYHTGGTTGRPKLAKRTHFNEVLESWLLRIGFDVKPLDAVMLGLPLFHCNGTIVTGLMPFSTGSNVVMLTAAGYRNQAVIKNFYKIVDKFKPVLFACVPTVLGMIMNVPIETEDVSSLRYCSCGAAPLSVELFNRFEEKTKIKILEGYGLTETTVCSALNPKNGDRRVGSVGLRLAYHWVRTVILDENGKYVRDCKVNEIGVVVIKGPAVFKGYVENEHNKNIWLSDGSFNTGDLGRVDEDGYIWLTGRSKDLIIRGGHNIDPSTIEEALYKLPYVKVAAAIGCPDAHAGEVPVAYVELSKDASVSEDEILASLKQKIGERASIPQKVKIVSAMPLTAVGKIFKPALRWDAIQGVYQKELSALKDQVKEVTVNAIEDKVHGTLVKVKIIPASGVTKEEIQKRVADILGRFTVHYDLKVTV